MSWFCLRMHAGYRCRHAGVCCRADWEIPAETHVLTAVDTTRLRSSAGGRALMAALDHAVELQVPRRADRSCLFYEPPRQGLTLSDGSGSGPGSGPQGLTPSRKSGSGPESGGCAIHREAGESALPTACRHFPREIVIDPRGTFVSLSHYCPTAAALLASPSALAIVAAQPPLVIAEPIDGLDAREVLPPLVRPGMLGDVEGYAAWESACLRILSGPEWTSSQALDAIEAMTERVRTWSPTDGPLAAFVRASTELRLGSDLPPVPVAPELGRSRVEARSKLGRSSGGRKLANDYAALVAQHVPEEAFPVAEYEERWAPLVEGSADVELVVKNYLGARAFANWVAYQGHGLRTVVEWLRTCHAVIRSEMALGLMSDGRPAAVADAITAAGRADLLMVHTVDSQRFANFFIDREGEP